MTSAEVQPVDLLISGADILVAPGKLIRRGFLGISGSSIAFVAESLPEGIQAKRTIDGRGRLVTPGFVNTHLHSALTMVRGVAADLGFAPSYTKGIPNAMQLSAEEATILAQLGALEAMLAGSTTIGEHFVHTDAALGALSELGLRVHASLRLHDVDFAEVANGRWTYRAEIGQRLLKQNIDLYERWHGKADDRIWVQFAAHAADTCSEPYLAQIREAARQKNARINTHLAQSMAEVKRVKEETGKTPAQVFNDAGLLDDNLLCGHCLFIDPEDFDLFAKSGAHVVQIPKCNAASGRIAPVHRFKAVGMNLALATDTQHGDMIELMRWALATGRIQEGMVSDSWQPADVFAMATINGAKALGIDQAVGTLEAGKRADIVIVDFRRPHLTPSTDPLGNLVHVAQGRDVEMVLVDGKIVVEAGRATQINQDEVMNEANRVAESLWSRARAAA